MTIFDDLKAPFSPLRISWRVGSTTADKKRGMALAYLDARDVMDRLDEVVGPGGWQCDYPHAGTKTVCRIGILHNDEWVWKADGAGDTDFEAEKGALSDSFKRAAVKWGIGRYLYDVAAPWVEIEPMGRSFKIKDSEKARLANLLDSQAPPDNTTDHVPSLPRAKSVDNYKALQAQIDECKTVEQLREWREGQAPQKKTLPLDWQLTLSKRYEEKMLELKQIEKVPA